MFGVWHIGWSLTTPLAGPLGNCLPWACYYFDYSGFLIIQTPIIRIQTLGCRLTSPCFWQQQEKDVAVTGDLLLEIAKLLYERLFPNATTPFSSSTGLGSRFTTCELASEAANAVVHCITAWQIKRRGKEDHSWLQSLACDQLNVALVLFCQPCPRFRPPGDYFRTTKTGLCLPNGPKAFSWQGSHKKMLTRYDIILAHIQ